jgi:hypothetical protein
MAFFSDGSAQADTRLPFRAQGEAGPASDRKECFGIYVRNVDRDE